MKKLMFVAVALAAGVMNFAVMAQEAPAIAASDEGSNRISKPDDARTARPAPMGRNQVAEHVYDQGKLAVPPSVGVDPTTTASVGLGRRPVLNAFARSETKVKGGGGVGVAVAGKAVGGGRYHDIVSRYAATYGVPVGLAHAVIRVESNYRPNAKGKAGEIGLMQIKPATARMMGYSGSTTGLFDPETNIRYGMKYLAKAQRLGDGSTCGTILKYNAGHAARRMNRVSRNYCGKVKRHLAGV